ncbi:hypothetical protein Golomagni_00262 [Golovinomyces magnicellulatus]|nr:hypothetical protein Golomagni_00262 [Golovinomyces magnicellulatus]
MELAHQVQVAYNTFSLLFFDGLNPDDIEDVTGHVARDDIDNNTIEDDPFIGVSPSFTKGSGSLDP